MDHPFTARVLLVEGDPEFAYLLGRYAERSGCSVVLAAPPAAAVTLARQAHPHLILIDLGFPPDDGLAALAELRADAVACDTPTYLCSAADLAPSAWEDQADGCLVKPIMYQDYLTLLAGLPGEGRLLPASCRDID